MTCQIYLRTKRNPAAFKISNLEGIIASSADGASGGGIEVELGKPIPILRDALYLFRGDTQLQVMGKDILAIHIV